MLGYLHDPIAANMEFVSYVFYQITLYWNQGSFFLLVEAQLILGGGAHNPGRGIWGGAEKSSKSLKSFGSSWGNSYTKFAILDITFRFTCG